MSDSRPIGIFDSGLGGLTVVKELKSILPSENIVYLGDTARVPYGNRSPETVIKFALEDMAFLMKRDVKMIVAACNTVSAVALKEMRSISGDIPVCGVIAPGAAAALNACRPGGRIVVLGTRATVRSKAYEKEINRNDSGITVESLACPLFVPLAEEGVTEGRATEAVFELYLADLKENPPDVLLLGCTHYPLLKDSLAKYLDNSTKILDSAETCAVHLKEFLAANDIQNDDELKDRDAFFVSDIASGFATQARRFLGGRVTDIEKAELN